MQLPFGVISCFGRELFPSAGGVLLWRGPRRITVWRLNRHVIGQYGDIPIVSFSCNPAQRHWFMTQTQEALQIVHRFDPIRFGRLQRQLKYVLAVSSDRRFLARYRSHLGVCEVNVTRLRPKFENCPETAAYIYAAVLVHEAAHGSIANGEIPLRYVARGHIEYFCNSEAAGFLRHWRPEAAELWMKKYHLAGKADSVCSRPAAEVARAETIG